MFGRETPLSNLQVTEYDDRLSDAYEPLPEAMGDAQDIWAFAKQLAVEDGYEDPQALFVQLYCGTK